MATERRAIRVEAPPGECPHRVWAAIKKAMRDSVERRPPRDGKGD